ncbi:MAG: PaRep2b protein, partial [Thermoproteus sp.]
MFEEERRALIDFVIRHLEGLGVDSGEFRQKLERRLGEWPARAPGDRNTEEGLPRVPHLIEMTKAERVGAQVEGFAAGQTGLRAHNGGRPYVYRLALFGEREAREGAQELKEMLLKEAERKGVEARRRLEQYFREGEMWGSAKPPFEKEVEVEGRRIRVRIEEVEAWKERRERKEHLVVKIRAVVEEDGRGVAVKKEARFYK